MSTVLKITTPIKDNTDGCSVQHLSQCGSVSYLQLSLYPAPLKMEIRFGRGTADALGKYSVLHHTMEIQEL